MQVLRRSLRVTGRPYVTDYSIGRDGVAYSKILGVAVQDRRRVQAALKVAARA